MKGFVKHGVKAKPSKIKLVQKVDGEINRLYIAVKHDGAKLEANGNTYAISYAQGGWHRISKKHYEILNNI